MNLRYALSLERDTSLRGLIDTGLALLVVVGLALNAWGIVMNIAVVTANDDVMPVIIDVPEIIVTDYGTPRRFVPEGKLLIFSDRIRIDFPAWEDGVPKGILGAPIRWWSKWLDYPLEGGVNIVSIGDVCRWLGTVLFMSGNILLVPRVCWRVLSGDLPRILK